LPSFFRLFSFFVNWSTGKFNNVLAKTFPVKRKCLNSFLKSKMENQRSAWSKFGISVVLIYL
jgi:hypothetical protein